MSDKKTKSPENAGLSDQFLGEELTKAENEKREALFHICPCPLEKTVSYGRGTARGPEAIIAASHQLERLIEGRMPCKKGIYTHQPIDCSGVIEQAIQALNLTVKAIADSGKIPIILGGEHSLSYGSVMGLKACRARPFGIIHIDAHADLRHAYQGEIHSHASVMNLLAKENIPIFQLGVRALCEEEMLARDAFNISYYDARMLAHSKIEEISLPSDFPEDVYISFDVDGLDPSIMPATGTAVPGGLGFYQAIDLLEYLCADRQIIGCDLVELAPHDAHIASDFTAALLVYHLLRLADL